MYLFGKNTDRRWKDRGLSSSGLFWECLEWKILGSLDWFISFNIRGRLDRDGWVRGRNIFRKWMLIKICHFLSFIWEEDLVIYLCSDMTSLVLKEGSNALLIWSTSVFSLSTICIVFVWIGNCCILRYCRNC